MRAGPPRRFTALLRAVASFALLALIAVSASPARALVQLANDGNGNTTPPADNFGFANVGVMSNGLTGVYLGNGWVITASHVGQANITLAGNVYTLVPGSWVHLQHSASPSLFADLGMERISGSPPLPSLVIAQMAPVAGETVSMAGNGWARQASQTCWDAGWNVVSCLPPPAYRGYKPLVGATPGPRWGRNIVTMTGFDVDFAGMRTRSFETAFDLAGLPEEAQAVVGDSGGGVFVKRGSQWQLVGILFAISTFEGQPNDSAVFGDRTYSVDLAYYRSQIMSIMNPPVVPALPWPGLVLAAGALFGAALSVRRRARS